MANNNSNNSNNSNNPNQPFGAQFDRLSRNALNIAENLSDSLGHIYVGSEHLVYGILSQDITNSLIQIQVKPNNELGYKSLIENIKVFSVNTTAQIRKTSKGAKLSNETKIFTKELTNVLDSALMVAMTYGYDKITIEHLFFGILETKKSHGKQVLGLTDAYSKEMVEFLVLHFEDYADKLETAADNQKFTSAGGSKPKSSKGANVLELYGQNLNQKVAATSDFSVTGREPELKQLILTLVRKQKNNPIVLGEPGVGKTALIELLANKINEGLVPQDLKGKQIYSIDTSSMLAGSIFRGEFEQKLKQLMAEVIEKKNIILFIDELHTVIGAGSGMDKGLDMSNILKPYLARGQISMIGASTNDEYRQVIKKDKAFERRFQPVFLDPPSLSETKDILMASKQSYADYHKVEISEDVIDKVLDLAARYLPHRYFPDKALDILDEACAYRKLQPEKLSHVLEKEDVNQIVAKMASIPLEKLNESIFTKIAKLEKVLGTQIFGQSEAISSLVKSLKRSYSGVNYSHGPISSFLFLGPTGVGKTQLVKTLANELFGNADKNLLKIDMSELSEKHNISRLTGTSAGYVGYDDAPQLTEFLLKQPNSIVLFDEIEKGHPTVLNLLLQMLEDGYITDGKGQRVSCKDAIIILTSNIGVSEFNNSISSIGFSSPKSLKDGADKNFTEAKKRVLETLSKTIKPEILGRLTDKIVFNPITKEILAQIIEHELNLVSVNFVKQSRMFAFKQEVVGLLVDKVGDGFKYGARDVKKVIQKELLDVLSESVLDNPGRFLFEVGINGQEVVVLKEVKDSKKKSKLGLNNIQKLETLESLNSIDLREPPLENEKVAF
jgi:ATP-dependent Clp protease ATP-binding subunit ClpC